MGLQEEVGFGFYDDADAAVRDANVEHVFGDYCALWTGVFGHVFQD